MKKVKMEIDPEKLKIAREKTKALLEGDGREVAKRWGVFVHPLDLARTMAIYECFKRTLEVPGHIMEVGVWNGSNLLYLTKLLTIYARYNHKIVIGFDTWEGLTEYTEKDGPKPEATLYQGDQHSIIAAAELSQILGYIKLAKGRVQDTLPVYLRENAHEVFSLVYLDVDLYDPTRCVLELMWPRLSVGGMIVLDEAVNSEMRGESIALQEFLPTIKGDYEIGTFPTTLFPSVWLRKTR